MLSIFAVKVKVIILVYIYFRPDFRGMRQTEIPEFGGLIWTANNLLHIFYLEVIGQKKWWYTFLLDVRP